jgi:hypothetical protein
LSLEKLWYSKLKHMAPGTAGRGGGGGGSHDGGGGSHDGDDGDDDDGGSRGDEDDDDSDDDDDEMPFWRRCFSVYTARVVSVVSSV